MFFIINEYLSLPIIIRVSFVLFICFFGVWGALRKIILRILAFIPFILEKIFKPLFLLIESPIAMIHKKIGGPFIKIDNGFSRWGFSIDEKLTFLYHSWRKPKEFNWIRVLICYLVCTIYVLLPSMLDINASFLTKGEMCFENMEQKLRDWMADTYNEEEIISDSDVDGKTQNDEEDILIVYGVSTSLLVRDNPSVEQGIVLKRLYNGNCVYWQGECVFAEVEDKIEPWVKIKTLDGVEGWCRLMYLYPKEYRNAVYHIKKEI